jgi:hypothetical protein
MVSLAALASQIAARPPHTPSPSASPSTGKISLEALSTMAASQGAAHSAAQNAAHANPAHSNPINASPSPATAAPTPAPAAPPIALVTKPSPPATSAATTTPLIGVGRLWNYTVSTKERQDKTEQIRLESVSGGWQRLSDGGEIHEDGRVRAVRLGSYLVRAVSDESFLRLPLRPGMSGANTAQVIDAQGRSANARVIWRTEANGTMVKLVASVDGVTFVMRYEALFDSAQLLPVRYESELKNRPASGPPISVVARLVP